MNVAAPLESDPRIEDAVRAIADGTPVAWNELEKSPADPGHVESLHLLEEIAAVFRTDAASVTHARRNVMFRWGGLDVEDQLGQGSFGEVYRAFDPWLGRHVALKLFRATGANGGGLDEARRLARLRQRNVLSVYGCGEHGGRRGMWSELIEGRTLAAIVADDGAFGPEEILRIGRDLAQALAVVHAAGLVHGDVKAENVMRESGGRIVLMDFGAGGEQRLLAGQRLISGTPRYLPPEVLDGAPLGMQSDLYSLGVLLYLLASARLPYAETDWVTLREAQRRGVPPLRGLYPELDPALCALIERCLVANPAQRPASAQVLSAQFAALFPAPVRTSGRLPVAALIAAAAALIGVVALWLWPQPAPAWDSAVQFLRVEPTGNVEIAANSTLRAGNHLRLSIRSSRDAYVYVLNEDAAGNATVLFPLRSETQNPLRSGAALLPPDGEGSTLAWEVTADSAREEFVVIASLTPRPELERDLSAWQRAQVADDARAVGAVVNAPALQVRGEHLRQILAVLARDAEHVRVWQYSFAHGS
jgi:hypothetical protein